MLLRFGIISRRLLVAAAALLMAGCGHHRPEPVSAAQYDAAAAGWIGRSESDLLRNWGVPSHSQLLSQGGQVLEYTERKGEETLCTTLFTSNIVGVIENYTWRGSRCTVPQLGEGS
jgi:hypothetical protein